MGRFDSPIGCKVGETLFKYRFWKFILYHEQFRQVVNHILRYDQKQKLKGKLRNGEVVKIADLIFCSWQ